MTFKVNSLYIFKARRRLDEGDPHVYTHEFGDALLKQDFAGMYSKNAPFLFYKQFNSKIFLMLLKTNK